MLRGSSPSVPADPAGAGTIVSIDTEAAVSPEVAFPPQLSGLPLPPADLLVDESGTLWIPLFTGTESGHKLMRYASNSLKSYDLLESPGSGLFSAIVRAPSGDILLAYGNVVVSFDPVDEAFSTLSLPESAYERGFTIEEGTWVTDMAVASSGEVYVSRMNVAALAVVDPENLQLVREIPTPETFGAVIELETAGDSAYMSNWFGSGAIPAQTAVLRGGEFEGVPGGGASSFVDVDGRLFVARTDGSIEVSLLPDAANIIARFQLENSGGKAYLAADSARDAVWVAGRDAGVILRASIDGATQATYQLPTTIIPAEVVRCPAPCEAADDLVFRTRVDGLAVGPDGTVYFADATAKRIGRISATN